MTDNPYFTPEFFTFFRDLAKNNDRDWFAANKERYEGVVVAPSLQFVRDAGLQLKKISPYLVADAKPFGGSLSRIYRDTRFSRDKSPYKTHVGIHFWHGKAQGPEHMAPGLMLHLEVGGSGAYSGSWHPDPSVLKKIRTRIVTEPEAWKQVLKARLDLEGESVSRPPPGFDPEHPLIRDLKRKDFVASRVFRDAEVTRPDFLEAFVKACQGMDPLNRFLADAVGLPW